jgi:hypothetical protein
VIEDDPLSEKQGEPSDPQIACVHEVRFTKLAPEREGQATAQVPQHRGAKRCASSDDRHTRKPGCLSAVGLIRSGHVQPRLAGEGCQVFSGRYENLGIRLGVGEWIFESEQDLHCWQLAVKEVSLMLRNLNENGQIAVFSKNAQEETN